MTRKPAILMIDQRVRLGGTDWVELDAAPDEATEIAAALTGVRSVLLALPDTWCLTARVSVGDLPRANRRQSIGYRLEEQLPVSVEDLAFDTLPLGEDEALGIAVQVERVAPLLAALEATGVEVVAIVPAALLAWIHPAVQKRVAGSNAIAVGDGPIHCFDVDGGALRNWYTLPADAGDVAHLLGTLNAQHVVAFGSDKAFWETVEFTGKIEHVTQSVDALMLDVNRTPGGLPIDLRRDRLRPTDLARQLRTPLIAAASAAAIFFAVFCGITTYRTGQYADVVAQSQEQQAEMFSDLYPDAVVPPAIGSRLASEVRHLGGTNASTDEVPQPQALKLLHATLSAVPPDNRFAVSELQLGTSGLTLIGSAATYEDAQALVNVLRAEPRLELDDPATEQGADGAVRFTLAVRLSVADTKGGRP